MVKPNWDIFRAKFNENPQNNFEWFCYLLFCKKFNRPDGIFRYINQSAIETNPIEIGNQVIGWQAKFYDTALSKHKSEILVTIKKAKRDYPNITTLYFYTNQEWGQNKGQKPKGLIEIETISKELAVTLDWKTAIFFESEFVTNDNAIIAQHFFSLDRSVFNLIEEQRKHTQNILHGIQTCISFNNNSIEIDRTDLLEKLKDKSHKIIILNGVGGVGKTVLIKKYYEQVKDKIPFFVFKATEFELNRINDLFNEVSVYDFLNAFKDENEKIIVIDSSEKLLDLTNTGPFKEFLLEIIENQWKIIFTTRDNYFDDLKFLLQEIDNFFPVLINVKILETENLISLSQSHSFSLPKDENLLELIGTPFYLNEYLNFYNEKEELHYREFKNKLWNQIIKKTKPEREKCFLKIAFERAKKSQYFSEANCESNILKELVNDGILGYETPGYFITHDIYEEWGLEKIIENKFINKSKISEFYQQIGKSLPVRRSFRNWLSDKLLLDDDNIKKFIEESIESSHLESFWKDEIFISVLLSDYSEKFFDIYANALLDNEQNLLKRLTFLLRLACKEVDDNHSRLINNDRADLFSLKYVFTKPKGKGWEELIKFVLKNIKKFGSKGINFIIPIINDWNMSIGSGETTRNSSLLALNYYKHLMDNGETDIGGDTKNQIIQTVFNGASEIRDELTLIFEDIIKNKWKHFADPYYDLSMAILTEMDGLVVAKLFPKYVLGIASLFWTNIPATDDAIPNNFRSRIEVEEYFGLESRDVEYFPPSAYQTPIYWLLQYSFKETLDFIISLTNMACQAYVNSSFDGSVKKVKLVFDGEEKEQFISQCLWNMYRGTGSPVSPYLLQSIHMALEKFFLDVGGNVDTEVLENWLHYLLRRSDSASISSVVTSIVLAYPFKTFNIAKILFKTKEFILFDTNRYVSDLSVKSLYLLGYGLNYKSKLYEDERLKTCEDKHREQALEHLFLKYQLFRNEGTTDDESTRMQTILFEILDSYYQDVPKIGQQNVEDKVWRLFLARMDRRKMSINTEEAEKGLLIKLDSELDPDLESFSENSIAKSSEVLQFLSLKNWSELKFRNNKSYKDYEQYENNPKFALKGAKEILKRLNAFDSSSKVEIESENEMFLRINYSIPTYVCAVLFRDHFTELSDKEKEYCKTLLIKSASDSLNPNYQYQISDGVDAAISLLPNILSVYPRERETIKTILLLSIFLNFPVGLIYSSSRGNYKIPISTIRSFWKDDIDDAISILFGYINLAISFEEFITKLGKKNYIKGKYNIYGNNLMLRFINENQTLVAKVLENKTGSPDIIKIKNIRLVILNTAFQLIPNRIKNDDIEKITKAIINIFVGKLLSDRRENRVEYSIKHDFLESYAYLILGMESTEIQEFIKPFVEKFDSSKVFADLFQEFVFAEMELGYYDSFWAVWDSFKDKIIKLCDEGDKKLYTGEIVRNFLFAHNYWSEDLKEWQSLKEKNKRFFNEISKKIGPSPSALYSISKLLDSIGSHYLNDGIFWISNILENNPYLESADLTKNTMYYIENITRKCIFKNRTKIKKTKCLYDSLVVILNFLVNRGSVVGYIMRESII